MTGRPLLGGVSLPLTGRHAVQGERARRGFELWRASVEAEGGLLIAGTRRPLDLRIVDDASSSRRAGENVRALAAGGADLLFGPYGRASCLAVATFTRSAGRVLWNHGSSADDTAGPLVVSLSTPASRYLLGVVDIAVARGCRSVLVAATDGPFAGRVAEGGAARAAGAGLAVRRLSIPPRAWPAHHGHLVAAASQHDAVILCGGLDDDVGAVAALRASGLPAGLAGSAAAGRSAAASGARPRVLGAVGAGVQAFGQALGPDAEGVIGPSQWEPDEEPVDLGPGGREMAAAYREWHEDDADYVVVQAWASGVLAAAALAAVGTEPQETWRWALGFRGRTGYGAFALASDGRQIGHRMHVVEWGPDGRRRPIA